MGLWLWCRADLTRMAGRVAAAVLVVIMALWGLIDVYSTCKGSRDTQREIAAQERWKLREREVKALERMADALAGKQGPSVVEHRGEVR